MNQNEGYSNNRRRNQRRNDRNRNDRNARNERKNVKDEHSSKNERRNRDRDLRDKKKNQRDSSQKNQRTNQQRELQNEIFKMLQKGAAENDAAIRTFKSTEKVCALCGQPISHTDLGSAVSSKNSDSPSHFDCVLKQVSENEKTEHNERVSYIGQGRFAILHFENPNDLRHFTIKKIIEWEKKEERLEWRDEMAGLFSHII